MRRGQIGSWLGELPLSAWRQSIPGVQLGTRWLAAALGAEVACHGGIHCEQSPVVCLLHSDPMSQVPRARYQAASRLQRGRELWCCVV